MVIDECLDIRRGRKGAWDLRAEDKSQIWLYVRSSRAEKQMSDILGVVYSCKSCYSYFSVL